MNCTSKKDITKSGNPTKWYGFCAFTKSIFNILKNILVTYIGQHSNSGANYRAEFKITPQPFSSYLTLRKLLKLCVF